MTGNSSSGRKPNKIKSVKRSICIPGIIDAELVKHAKRQAKVNQLIYDILANYFGIKPEEY